jgi:hypothetical protein
LSVNEIKIKDRLNDTEIKNGLNDIENKIVQSRMSSTRKCIQNKETNYLTLVIW